MLASPPLVPSIAENNYDDFVPDALVRRMYDGGESAVAALTAELSMRQRANLAVFCYRKSHLHSIGLAIAATCDQSAFVELLGAGLGGIVYAQSRERAVVPHRAGQRPKITLATFARPASDVVADEPADLIAD